MGRKPFAFSGKALVTDGSGRYLLIRRSKASKHNAGKWDLPGGKVDPGEDIDQALIREVAEETGLTVSLERVIGAAESETPLKRVAYLIFEGSVGDGKVTLSDEHDCHKWVAREELGDADVCAQFAPLLKRFASGETGGD